MSTHWGFIAVAAALVAIGEPMAAGQEADDGVAVIVNAENPETSLSASGISRMLLKRSTKWEDGSEIMPVDQKYDNDITALFCRQVHRKNVSWLRSYWRKQVFSGGRYPPPQLGDNDAVIAFVKSNVGGIGYVASATEIPEGVKVISIDE